MSVGRPKKYTKKRLSEGVERYFCSISRTITAVDEDGERIKNDDGEYIKLREYVVPPSISGLCVFLGIDKSTWSNYCSEELHPELRGITQEVRTRIEAYLEDQLLNRKKGIQGVMFNLQHNYGWKQKSEIELGEGARSAVASSNLSLNEKLAFIASIMEQQGGFEDG